MSLISKPMKNIKTFFDNRFKGLEKKLDIESKELHKVENTIKNLKQKGGKINAGNNGARDFSGWSDKKMIKFWFFGLIIGLLGYFVYNTLDIIFLIIGAYIVSMIAESLILFLQKIKFNRGLAVIVAYIIFIVVLIGLFIFVVPFLLTQLTELISIGVSHIAGLQEILVSKGITQIVMDIKRLPLSIKDYFLNYFGDSEILLQIQTILQQNLTAIISLGKEYVQIFGFILVDFVSGLASMVTNFTLFITLAILFSLEKESVMKFLASLSGEGHYDLIYMKLEKMYKKLAIWLKARLALSLFVAVSMWLALWIMSWFGLEIPNKLGLALLTGMLDIIPYIGPFISGALLFMVGMIYNTIIAAVLAVGILFGVNLLQNNILTPLFMNRALGVNSVLILISMVIGGMIMGFLGVLLAVPIAVIITLLTQNRAKLEKNDIEGSATILENIIYKNKETKNKETKDKETKDE